MKYYHGTKVTGLFELVPINSADTTLHKPTIYFTDFFAFFIFYIWNKPLMKKAIADGDFDAKDVTPPMVFVVNDQNTKPADSLT